MLNWTRSDFDPWNDIPESGLLAVVVDFLIRYEATLHKHMEIDEVISDYAKIAEKYERPRKAQAFIVGGDILEYKVFTLEPEGPAPLPDGE